MPSIQRRYFRDAESFRGCDDRRIDRSKGTVTVLGDKFCDPQPITGENRFGDEIALGKVGEESDFGFDSQTGFQQVGHFRDDQRRHEQRSGMGLEKFEAGLVVAIVPIDVGEERPSVDDQSDDPNSAARISSIRSELSVHQHARSCRYG